MEEILKNISDLQREALLKGIDFDVELYFNDQKVPSIDVKMSYTVTGHINESRAWNTTFSTNNNSRHTQEKLEGIHSFVSTIPFIVNNE